MVSKQFGYYKQPITNVIYVFLCLNKRLNANTSIGEILPQLKQSNKIETTIKEKN